MPCYYPITGYQPHGGGPLSFNNKLADHNTITIPCGQCIGCRIKLSREWATRCMHEKQMHKHNCTITLTYNDEHLPEQQTLQYADFQLFMKRLRKRATLPAFGLLPATPAILLSRNTTKIRFYMGGEYGEKYGRPHFHACLFGIDFADRIYNRTTPAGSKIFTSNTLDKLWKKGFASIGDLTFESAAYIARYIMKKQTGDKKKHYEIQDMETGEIQIRKKEFNQMSRQPGLGQAWLKKYEKDVYPHGKVIIRGHRVNTPRYYDKKYKETNQLEYEQLQYQRQQEAKTQTEHHTPERLAVQEQVKKASIKSLKRNLDKDNP